MTSPTNWDTKLTVMVGTEVITPIDSFSPTISVPMQPVHSLERDNVGHVAQPATFTFTMAVKAVGPVVAKLTDMARKRTSFTVSVSPASGTDWTFQSISFNDCFITSVANTIVIEGVPTTTFNCICLEYDQKA